MRMLIVAGVVTLAIVGCAQRPDRRHVMRELDEPARESRESTRSRELEVQRAAAASPPVVELVHIPSPPSPEPEPIRLAPDAPKQRPFVSFENAPIYRGIDVWPTTTRYPGYMSWGESVPELGGLELNNPDWIYLCRKLAKFRGEDGDDLALDMAHSLEIRYTRADQPKLGALQTHFGAAFDQVVYIWHTQDGDLVLRSPRLFAHHGHLEMVGTVVAVDPARPDQAGTWRTAKGTF
jgi:hypothetical protein